MIHFYVDVKGYGGKYNRCPVVAISENMRNLLVANQDGKLEVMIIDVVRYSGQPDVTTTIVDERTVTREE